MGKTTHTIHVVRGEFCTSRNGDVAWTVGAFATRELADVAASEDALESATESDVIVLPDGKRYVKDSVHDVLVEVKPEMKISAHDWDLDYSITEHDVSLPVCEKCAAVDEVVRLWRLADAGDANAVHHLETFGGAR